MPWPEKCHYCGKRYHPMMVWTLKEEAPPEGHLTREKWLEWQEGRIAARRSGKPMRIHACTIMVIDDGTGHLSAAPAE